ncbi:MAG TPA: acetyl-CoA carboxylase biotin carboxyl carrier protein [Planctomycetaceae bacterium]|nr:acetyl-CoA carboxylase biotin carboxyl carrier protein [Planctomycetaceae bacterium]
MANGGSGGGDVFDVRKVRRLVELMNEHELAEIDLKQADQRIRLRRGQDPILTAGVTTAPASPPAVAPAAPVVEAPPAASPAAEDPSAAYITSPMVGTFYTASSPDSPDFVNVGDQVNAETVVCILEAMKVFNEIPAECSGKIVARLVENGDAIEFGQKLFQIQPN